MPSRPFPEAKKIKKSRGAANRTRGVTGRHPFSPSGDNYGWQEAEKDTLISLKQR